MKQGSVTGCGFVSSKKVKNKDFVCNVTQQTSEVMGSSASCSPRLMASLLGRPRHKQDGGNHDAEYSERLFGSDVSSPGSWTGTNSAEPPPDEQKRGDAQSSRGRLCVMTSSRKDVRGGSREESCAFCFYSFNYTKSHLFTLFLNYALMKHDFKRKQGNL